MHKVLSTHPRGVSAPPSSTYSNGSIRIVTSGTRGNCNSQNVGKGKCEHSKWGQLGAKKDRIFASYGALKTHTEAKHRGQEPMFVVEN